MIQRFQDKVDVTDKCWIYKANRSCGGYGIFSIGRKSIYAHRFSYEYYKGKIPDGLHIDHLCRNPNCVNPNHLEAVSKKENTMRGKSPSSLNSKKTHCPFGHEYNISTIYQYKKGKACKICVLNRSHNQRISEKLK